MWLHFILQDICSLHCEALANAGKLEVILHRSPVGNLQYQVPFSQASRGLAFFLIFITMQTYEPTAAAAIHVSNSLSLQHMNEAICQNITFVSQADVAEK